MVVVMMAMMMKMMTATTMTTVIMIMIMIMMTTNTMMAMIIVMITVHAHCTAANQPFDAPPPEEPAINMAVLRSEQQVSDPCMYEYHLPCVLLMLLLSCCSPATQRLLRGPD